MTAHIKTWQERIENDCHREGISSAGLVPCGASAALSARDAEIAELRAGYASAIKENQDLYRGLTATPDIAIGALKRLIAVNQAHETLHAPDGDDIARMVEYSAAFEFAEVIVDAIEALASVNDSLEASVAVPSGMSLVNNEELAALYHELSGKTHHASDCATSNAPAETPGRCDCDVPVAQPPIIEHIGQMLTDLREYRDQHSWPIRSDFNAACDRLDVLLSLLHRESWVKK